MILNMKKLINRITGKLKSDVEEEGGVEIDMYKNHRFVEDAIIYESGFHPIWALRNFFYDLYHPANYRR